MPRFSDGKSRGQWASGSQALIWNRQPWRPRPQLEKATCSITSASGTCGGANRAKRAPWWSADYRRRCGSLLPARPSSRHHRVT